MKRVWCVAGLLALTACGADAPPLPPAAPPAIGVIATHPPAGGAS